MLNIWNRLDYALGGTQVSYIAESMALPTWSEVTRDKQKLEEKNKYQRVIGLRQPSLFQAGKTCVVIVLWHQGL